MLGIYVFPVFLGSEHLSILYNAQLLSSQMSTLFCPSGVLPRILIETSICSPCLSSWLSCSFPAFLCCIPGMSSVLPCSAWTPSFGAHLLLNHSVGFYISVIFVSCFNFLKFRVHICSVAFDRPLVLLHF